MNEKLIYRVPFEDLIPTEFKFVYQEPDSGFYLVRFNKEEFLEVYAENPIGKFLLDHYVNEKGEYRTGKWKDVFHSVCYRNNDMIHYKTDNRGEHYLYEEHKVNPNVSGHYYHDFFKDRLKSPHLRNTYVRPVHIITDEDYETKCRNKKGEHTKQMVRRFYNQLPKFNLAELPEVDTQEQAA
jgi:hypothetical protein